MKHLLVLVLVTLTGLSTFAADFPMGPDANLTPGALCTRPNSHRYPEGINYCERNVDSGTKKDIFIAYDQLGFRTRSMPRGAFKIDHYIPLCMGGANDIKNLWPQHQSIYTITDPLEPVLCQKMSEGKLLQKDAVRMIMQGKAHLDQVPALIKQAMAL